MKYKNYTNARDVSWFVLITTETKELPVSVSKICDRYMIGLHKYSSTEALMLPDTLKEDMTNNDGFTIANNCDYHIFYNDKCTDERSRFVIAHELGHILMGHLDKEKTEDMEQEANVFASRLLMPSCVLNMLQVDTAEKIAETCHVSLESATHRFERLKELNKRGFFGKHRFEKKVIQNFREFTQK